MFYVVIIAAKRAQVSGTNDFFSISPAVNHSFRALEISMYVLPVVTGLKNLFCSSWRGEEVRSAVSLRKVRKLVCELKLFFSVNNFTDCLSVREIIFMALVGY